MEEHQYNKNLYDEESDSDISQSSTSYLLECFTKEDRKLITQVRAHSFIYSSKLNKKNKEDTEHEIKLAWEAIGEYLNTSVSECQHRRIILRQRFCKQRIKRDSSENPTVSGKFSFYHYMKWLDPYVPRRRKRAYRPLVKVANTSTSKKSCLDASNHDQSERSTTPERAHYDSGVSIDPPDFLMVIDNDEEVHAPNNAFTNEVLSSNTTTDSLKDKNSSQCIQKRITQSFTPTLNECNKISECSTAKENEKPYSLYDDEDDFDFASDSVSFFTSSSFNNSRNETNHVTKFSSKLDNYEIQRQALINLTNTVNKVINTIPITVKERANKEKYKILGQLVNSHLQSVTDESLKMEIKSKITRIV